MLFVEYFANPLILYELKRMTQCCLAHRFSGRTVQGCERKCGQQQNQEKKSEKMSEKKSESIADKKVSRRSVLKWTGALAGAAVVGGIATFGISELSKPTAPPTPPPTPPTSFKPPLSPEVQTRVDEIVKGLIDRRAGETVTRAMCGGATRAGCGSKGCAFKVHSKNGVVTGAEPDDTAHPNIGREDAVMNDTDIVKARWSLRGCPKGAQFPKWIYDPSRIIYPMKRVDFDPKGERNPQNRGMSGYVRISWDEALDMAVSELKRCKDLYGTASILQTYNTNVCNPHISRLLSNWSDAGAGAWGHCSVEPARVGGWVMFGEPPYGGSATGWGNDGASILSSKLIVMFGCAMGTTTNISNTAMFVRLARERGIPTILVEAKYVPEAETLFDQVIYIRPATNTAMMSAIAYTWFQEDTYDKDFIAKYVEPTGFQKWKDYVTGVEDGVAKTPEWAEPITAVPAETIRELARLMAKNRPKVVSYLHWGAIRKPQGENDSRIGGYLSTMLGAWGVEGGYPSFGQAGDFKGRGGFSSRYDEATMGEWGPYRVAALVRGGKWPHVVILLKDFWAGKFGDPKDPNTRKTFDRPFGGAAGWNAVKASPSDPTPSPYGVDLPKKIGIIWNWNNPSVSGNAGGLGTGVEPPPFQAYKAVDFVLMYAKRMYSSQRYADLLLPTDEVYEHEEIRATNVGFATFGYVPKLKEPEGEAKNMMWISTEIAKRLGDDVVKRFNHYYAPGKSWDDQWHDYVMEAFKGAQAKMANEKLPMPTWEEFTNGKWIGYHEYFDKPNVQMVTTTIEQGKLKTKSKKIEFYSEMLATEDPMQPHDWDDTENNEQTVMGYSLPAVGKYWPSHRHFYGDVHGTEDLIKDYPLYMFTNHSRYRMHSAYWMNPYLRGDIYTNRLWMNTADAKARGLSDGDWAYVYNENGEFALPVYITSRMTPGCVMGRYGGSYEPNGAGLDLGGNINSMMWIYDADPNFPAHTVALVQVRQYNSPYPAGQQGNEKP
jgi:anaerobic dimethyl sulfoxide reductase subunit A